MSEPDGQGRAAPPRKPGAVPWPVVAVIVLVAAGLIAFFALRGRGGPAAAPAPSSSSTVVSVSPAPSGSSGPVAGVDGCLGGADPSVAIYAASKAPLTRAGAVSFLATVLRWVALAPKPAGQWTAMAPKAMTSDIARGFTANAAPTGTKRWADTNGSVYKVTSFSGGSAAVALTLTSTVAGNGQEQSGTTAVQYGLDTKDGHWVITSAADPKPGSKGPRQQIAAVEQGGARLPGGCGQ